MINRDKMTRWHPARHKEGGGGGEDNKRWFTSDGHRARFNNPPVNLNFNGLRESRWCPPTSRPNKPLGLANGHGQAGDWRSKALKGDVKHLYEASYTQVACAVKKWYSGRYMTEEGGKNWRCQGSGDPMPGWCWCRRRWANIKLALLLAVK